MTEKLPAATPETSLVKRLYSMRGKIVDGMATDNDLLDVLADAAMALEHQAAAVSEKVAIGLFWQTSDGKWHFSPGSTNRGDIHDNGRPIRLAYLGEEAK